MCASIPESKLKFPHISSEKMNFFLYIKSKEMFSSEMTNHFFLKCIKCSETTAKHKSLCSELIGPMKRFSSVRFVYIAVSFISQGRCATINPKASEPY